MKTEMDGYFRTANGTRIWYSTIAQRIRDDHPALVGKHISKQLEAVGLYDAMLAGSTPCSLPYTFTE